MTGASFSTVPLSGASFALGTMSGTIDAGMRAVGSTTTSDLSDLQIYLKIGSCESLERVLEEPPSVNEVVHAVLREPGLKASDLAVELLGRMSARTLHFALQILPFNDRYFRPVYSDKVWEIIISALGMADDTYAGFIEEYMGRLLNDPNPVKRLAAFDALETLRD
jgi:hypothetical protein